MKPTLNYGLSDSLIDVVRKAVEEAKLHPNQQKLDVHEPEKDELTSQDFKKLRAGKKAKDGIDTKPKLKEEEQIDELSVNKMLKYTDAANKNREVLNKKWDTGTATEREQNKVLGHEAGVDRAAARVKAKTGKNPNEIGKLSRMKYAVTKEEEQIDEAPMKSGAQSRREVDSFMDQYGLGSKQKEAPKSNIRKVVGKSYGADYKDPEGEDETAADMKKPEPKRKSGPQGTMARRFNTKSYDKIKGKLKAQY